jgi:hypothetical protein
MPWKTPGSGHGRTRRARAGIGPQQPGNNPQGGRLARPVGAQQCIELAGKDRQIKVVDGRPIIE